MSASRQFQKLNNNPLDRQSRQKGGILGALLRAEKAANSASPREEVVGDKEDLDDEDKELVEEEEEDEEEDDEEEDNGAELLVLDPRPKQQRKRKAHTKKKRSIAHWLHKSGTCLLCNYKQDNFRADTLLRHWRAEHATQLKAAEAAQDDGKDLRAAVGALVDSVRGPQGSIMSFVRKKSRLQGGRWHKELGVIRFIIRKKIPFDAVDSEEFSDMLTDFGVSLDGKRCRFGSH